jgi:hypothetical protein
LLCVRKKGERVHNVGFVLVGDGVSSFVGGDRLVGEVDDLRRRRKG